MPTPGTPSPEQLRILLARAEREGLDASVIERLTVILHFAEHRYSISEVSRQFGISRSTFHRWIERFDPENLSSLADKSHEPQTLRQSAIDAQTIELIRRYRMRYPQMGKERIAELLMSDHGVSVSPSSVGRVIERNCLYFADTPFHWKKRLEKQAISKVSDTALENRSLEGCADGAAVSALPDSSARPSSTFSQDSSARPSSTFSQDSSARPSWPRLPEEVSSHVTVEPESEPENSTEALVPVYPFNWRGVKRLIIVSSIITNAAFVSLLLGSALLEHVSTPAPSDVATETLHAAPAHQYLK